MPLWLLDNRPGIQLNAYYERTDRLRRLATRNGREVRNVGDRWSPMGQTQCSTSSWLTGYGSAPCLSQYMRTRARASY